jgi:hypothetical protein
MLPDSVREPGRTLTVNTTAASGTATGHDTAAWFTYRRACRSEQPNRPASTRAASAGTRAAGLHPHCRIEFGDRLQAKRGRPVHFGSSCVRVRGAKLPAAVGLAVHKGEICLGFPGVRVIVSKHLLTIGCRARHQLDRPGYPSGSG